MSDVYVADKAFNQLVRERTEALRQELAGMNVEARYNHLVYLSYDFPLGPANEFSGLQRNADQQERIEHVGNLFIDFISDKRNLEDETVYMPGISSVVQFTIADDEVIEKAREKGIGAYNENAVYVWHSHDGLVTHF
ncbi:MAG: hypothetical protein GY861_13475 [bacterium]|nr:hypothetical protein [bacterium]